jgi:hypothetical protein
VGLEFGPSAFRLPPSALLPLEFPADKPDQVFHVVGRDLVLKPRHAVAALGYLLNKLFI